ncbi:phage tail protein [Pedobacter sp. KACC 23697]|uniref:Tail fiber protein n=1 Tax=Pedobacter sp. KACC 23697 TaxID=3149230 RepID=A0AAU7K0E0_9SPHI
MEGTIGEIRAFAGTFAPVNWQFCQGQPMSLQQYQALFAIIGTIYGGDGVNTFNLPNIASRVVVGAGQGTGLSAYPLGLVRGEENHTLTYSELPMHTHVPAPVYSTTAASAKISLNAINADGSEFNPVGHYFAKDGQGQDSLYAITTGSPNLVSLNSNAATITNLSPPIPAVAISVSGSSLPHSNIQPVLALNYIICVEGIFPSRN